MYKQGIVCDVNEKYATIYFLRDSACGGECVSCKGCEAQEMTVQVLNTQGASTSEGLFAASPVLPTGVVIWLLRIGTSVPT